ncbi:hypothetical protein ZHAS_00013127 [Anopheles sinensis]|uniref:Uncharacterized protein n=1 Tax=Anopheles sinensis TaxID=74873 RepID=A0A084W4M5_ANOSI|nr:hypothetical protein ZHAS_00013127 [Anopheles sinensis]
MATFVPGSQRCQAEAARRRRSSRGVSRIQASTGLGLACGRLTKRPQPSCSAKKSLRIANKKMKVRGTVSQLEKLRNVNGYVSVGPVRLAGLLVASGDVPAIPREGYTTPAAWLRLTGLGGKMEVPEEGDRAGIVFRFYRARHDVQRPSCCRPNGNRKLTTHHGFFVAVPCMWEGVEEREIKRRWEERNITLCPSRWSIVCVRAGTFLFGQCATEKGFFYQD